MSGTEAIRVASRGAELAVQVQGRSDAPVVLLVHGFPDDHTVWEPVATRLAVDHRVATLDLRGMGASTGPGAGGFSYAALAGDVGAVAAALGGRVHLVGHDWGSIIGWLAVTDRDAAPHLASFTSISGPHPELYRDRMIRGATSGPGELLGVVGQLVRSSYGLLFQVPGLAEALVGRIPASGWRLTLRDAGVPADDPLLEVDEAGLHARMRAGLGLYRNAARERAEMPVQGSVEVPVQLIVPVHDRYLGEAVLTHRVAEVARTAYLRRVHTGHWPLRSRPELVSAWVSEVVESVESGEVPVSLDRCRMRAPSSPDAGEFAGKVVLVTGAASGIGRATALAFAASGADLVIADVDKGGAGTTAELAAGAGSPRTAVYEVDVSDRDAMIAFGEAVHAAHGAVDVLVNNAGIGVGGPFLAHDLEDWDRVVAVNLLGVVHGCHVFGREMLRSGRGGHVVNISSLAGLIPTPSLSAYSATKFAVLGLSEALRAEWRRHGVGVTAVCPGVVNTPIVERSAFVGADAGTADSLRRTAAAFFARFGHDPELVARRVVEAVRDDVAVQPAGAEVRLLGGVMRFAPGLIRRVAARPGPLDSVL